MDAVSSYRIYSQSRSAIKVMMDLRFSYAVMSSGLILLGFFWNNLQGFSLRYVVLIISVFCANVFMFVVNDFYDAPHDAKDSFKRKRNVFCSVDTYQTGKIVLYASLVISLLLGAFVSLPLFVVIALFDVLAFSYSAPQIKLRNRAYWDWIFVFLWKGLVIAASYIFFFGTSLSAATFFMVGTTAIILLLSLIGQLDNQIRDFTVDRLNNTNHSSQRLGHKASSLLKTGLLAVFFGFSLTFCYVSHLYITFVLIGINISFYLFSAPTKYSHVLDFASIWIVILFLEHFMEFFSYHQQLVFSAWIVVMIGIAVFHVRRTQLFKKSVHL